MDATLRITTALRRDKTVLKTAYCTTPFKVADVTENKSAPVLKLMLMTSSPGILSGDHYHIEVEVAEGCALELQTQSYQRIFTMKDSATQQMNVRLAHGASFTWLPHPTVPHVHSSFATKNNIWLSGGNTLTWGEILTCGRMLKGEAFTFNRYHNVTSVYLGNKPVIKENLLLQPLQTDVTTLGQMEGYTHQSSLLFVNADAGIQHLIDEIRTLLANEANMTFGVSALPINGLMVRMLGYKAEQLYNLHLKLQTLLATMRLSSKLY